MKDRIVAHRGNAAEFRENSLEAIQSAIDLGCQYVEFDVQMSSDGIPHVLHDHNLSRLFGKDRDAFDTRSAALSEYGIPRLQETTELLSRYPDVTAFVEVKTQGMTRFGREIVIRAVRELAEPSQCVLISFDLDALPIARAAGYRIGAAISEPMPEVVERCLALAPEFMFCDHKRVLAPLWRGPQWCAWEVSDSDQATKLVRRGFSLLESMQVRKLMAEIASA